MTRRPGLSVRLKLTLSYAGFLLLAGTLLLAVVWVFLLRYVPPDAAMTANGFMPGRDDLVRAFAPKAAWAVVTLLAFGLVGGWVLAGRMLAPLDRITRATRMASKGSLSYRIELEGRMDEFRELADAFDAMLARLEAHVAQQQRFAANASHELRSPLTTVKTMIDVTPADPDVDPGGLRALAERIRDVNQSNIDTIEALLDLATVGDTLFTPESVDATALIEEITKELADEVEEKRLTLTTHTAGTWTLGSPILLRQAISNLLRNATRHNHPDGQITVLTATLPESIRLTVANTGAAIPVEMIGQLAEPFARAHGRTLTRGTGHGLGLAIVAAIATAHKGTLTLEPNPGGGLIAHLDLPTPSRPPVR